jgi:hypothetical protein
MVGCWCLTPLSTHFSYIVAISFICGGNWSTRRKPHTCRKSLTNFITSCCIEYVENKIYLLQLLRNRPEKHIKRSLYFLFLNIYIHRGRDRMVVWFATTWEISAYYHQSCEFEPRSCWDVLDTTWCDKVCQWLAASRWFSTGAPVSTTNKTNRHYITEMCWKWR